MPSLPDQGPLRSVGLIRIVDKLSSSVSQVFLGDTLSLTYGQVCLGYSGVLAQMLAWTNDLGRTLGMP